MKNNFEIDGVEYNVYEATAITGCDMEVGEAARQDVLVVENEEDGEMFRYVVFNWKMPETLDDFADMCNDSQSWESDFEVLETIKYV